MLEKLCITTHNLKAKNGMNHYAFILTIKSYLNPIVYVVSVNLVK